jgi:hypothetical protein
MDFDNPVACFPAYLPPRSLRLGALVSYHKKVVLFMTCDTDSVVRHECEQAVVFICPSVIACNCARDEGRPLGADLQELASNHLKLLWSKATVVSV